jgi:hypothetical protein
MIELLLFIVILFAVWKLRKPITEVTDASIEPAENVALDMRFNAMVRRQEIAEEINTYIDNNGQKREIYSYEELLRKMKK